MHPNGTRFATAGSDHKVKVWNLLPVLDVQQELTAGTPKLLATLADHFGPVNVARFSHDGRFLASGAHTIVLPSLGDWAAASQRPSTLHVHDIIVLVAGPVCYSDRAYGRSLLCAGSDDKSVCLYELRTGTGAKSFGSSDGPNVENWKHTATLRGHLENILDVAWSPDDRFIASSSVDNQVCCCRNLAQALLCVPPSLWRDMQMFCVCPVQVLVDDIALRLSKQRRKQPVCCCCTCSGRCSTWGWFVADHHLRAQHRAEGHRAGRARELRQRLSLGPGALPCGCGHSKKSLNESMQYPFNPERSRVDAGGHVLGKPSGRPVGHHLARLRLGACRAHQQAL